MLASAFHTETLRESVFAKIQGREQIENKDRRDCRLNEFITLSKKVGQGLCVFVCVCSPLCPRPVNVHFIFIVLQTSTFSLVLYFYSPFIVLLKAIWVTEGVK